MQNKNQTNLYLYKGTRDLVAKYELFVIDLWGVIHDGNHVYPGVVQCLKNIRSAGKQIAFLSNSSSLNDHLIESLISFGITPDMYDLAITAGQCAHDKLSNEKSEIVKEIGKNYFYFGPDNRQKILQNIPHFKRVNNLAAADFLITTGVDPNLDVDSTLKAASERKIPMVCPNPDIYIVRIDGSTRRCAGYFANLYEETYGSKVYFYGKPYKDIYLELIENFQNTTIERMLAIGDNLQTDIKGAQSVNMDSLLIMSGVTGMEITKESQLTSRDAETFSNFCSQHNLMPSGLMKKFIW